MVNPASDGFVSCTYIELSWIFDSIAILTILDSDAVLIYAWHTLFLFYLFYICKYSYWFIWYYWMKNLLWFSSSCFKRIFIRMGFIKFCVELTVEARNSCAELTIKQAARLGFNKLLCRANGSSKEQGFSSISCLPTKPRRSCLLTKPRLSCLPTKSLTSILVDVVFYN